MIDSYDYYYLEVGKIISVQIQHNVNLSQINDVLAMNHCAIEQGQIIYIYNFEEKVIGYFSWALLTPEVAEALSRDENYRLHASEWNEGDQLWIMDICAKPGSGIKVFSEISKFLDKHTGASWHSRRKRKKFCIDGAVQ